MFFLYIYIFHLNSPSHHQVGVRRFAVSVGVCLPKILSSLVGRLLRSLPVKPSDKNAANLVALYKRTPRSSFDVFFFVSRAEQIAPHKHNGSVPAGRDCALTPPDSGVHVQMCFLSFHLVTNLSVHLSEFPFYFAASYPKEIHGPNRTHCTQTIHSCQILHVGKSH